MSPAFMHGFSGAGLFITVTSAMNRTVRLMAKALWKKLREERRGGFIAG
jgi:hypothetical protein